MENNKKNNTLSKPVEKLDATVSSRHVNLRLVILVYVKILKIPLIASRLLTVPPVGKKF
jgi:hypothetical protein